MSVVAAQRRRLPAASTLIASLSHVSLTSAHLTVSSPLAHCTDVGQLADESHVEVDLTVESWKVRATTA